MEWNNNIYHKEQESPSCHDHDDDSMESFYSLTSSLHLSNNDDDDDDDDDLDIPTTTEEESPIHKHKKKKSISTTKRKAWKVSRAAALFAILTSTASSTVGATKMNMIGSSSTLCSRITTTRGRGNGLAFVGSSNTLFTPKQQQLSTACRPLWATSSSSSSKPSTSSTTRKAKQQQQPKIEQLTPLTASSESKRRTATKALQRAASSYFLTTDSNNDDETNTINQTNKRPKGRPNSVPGAMSLSTTRRINEASSASSASYSAAVAAVAASASTDTRTIMMNAAAASSIATAAPPKTKRKRGRPRKNPLPEETDHNNSNVKEEEVKQAKDVITQVPPLISSSDETAGAATTTTTTKTTTKKITKKRGRKPNKITTNMDTTASSTRKKRTRKQSPLSSSSISSTPKTTTTATSTSSSSPPSTTTTPFIPNDKKKDPLSLQRYYKTDLLSKQDEYALGMKIQFMVLCEAVHEGLVLELCREPSIVEWAYACGFTTPDPEMSSQNYIETDLDESIRPSKSETGGIGGNAATTISSAIINNYNNNINDDAEQPEPNNMFVGNGLATNAGVGRGRGRVKKPPPTKLRDFYDDSEFMNDNNDEDDAAKSKKQQPKTTNTINKNNTSFQKPTYPNQRPINRGTPKDFRELMLQGREAKQRMVQCNMRLVVSIARRYHNVGVNVQDLVQEGSLGLSRAAEKFDPKKGFKFSTYASWWIQQAVFRSIAYHSRTIRLPVHIHNLLNRMRRARQSLQQELGRVPSNEEVAAQLDMTTEKYNKILRMTRRSISLEMPKYQNNPKDMGHESEALVVDKIDSSEVLKDEQTPEQTVDVGLFQSDLKEMLKILGDDERRVISARYGLDDGLTRTVTAVAAQMNQSKSWVRSQECRALRKLRRPWYEKRLKEHQKSCAGLS